MRREATASCNRGSPDCATNRVHSLVSKVSHLHRIVRYSGHSNELVNTDKQFVHLLRDFERVHCVLMVRLRILSLRRDNVKEVRFKQF